MPFAAIGGLVTAGAATGTAATIAGVAATTLAAGGGLQAYGASKQAKAQKAMYRYNEQVALGEAAQIRRANLEEQKTRRGEMRKYLKSVTALQAKSGITGVTNMEVQLAIISDMSEDIAALSQRYDIETKRQVSQAAISKYRGKQAVAAGKLGVATALVGGVSSLAMMGLKTKLQTG